VIFSDTCISDKIDIIMYDIIYGRMGDFEISSFDDTDYSNNLCYYLIYNI
jgi:hypothetical protein